MFNYFKKNLIVLTFLDQTKNFYLKNNEISNGVEVCKLITIKKFEEMLN